MWLAPNPGPPHVGCGVHVELVWLVATSYFDVGNGCRKYSRLHAKVSHAA